MKPWKKSRRRSGLSWLALTRPEASRSSWLNPASFRRWVKAVSRAADQTASTPTPAPPFSLTDTTGATVDLAGFLGRNVILYFSEGAGCQSCLLQMAQIEAQQAKFHEANITVLPIVMNTKDQITADMAANNVRTPFLLDDGTVSTAYGTIGRGMHAGLPGHSFVVIDTEGMQRWYGEYPSMWLEPADLLAKAQAALSR